MRALGLALLLASCSGSLQGQRCGAFDACQSGLECRHGGPRNLGTCEHSCGTDADCAPDQRCELEPLPDALSHVCVSGVRTQPNAMYVVNAIYDGESVELEGDALAPSQCFMLLGTPSLACITRRDDGDCDHCASTRWFAQSQTQVSSPPLAAVGPIDRVLLRARADQHQVEPDDDWRVEIAVDLDGDGQSELERVVRCDAWLPSGCSARVCNRICRGTRTSGSSEVRAPSCQSFVPDIEDCLSH